MALQIMFNFVSKPSRSVPLVILGTIFLWIIGYNLTSLIAQSEAERFTMQLYGTRLSLFISLLFLLRIFWKNKTTVINSISSSTRNLSIFRLIFFGFFFIGAIFNIDSFWASTLSFARLPESAEVSFPVFGWLFQALPRNEFVVRSVLVLFIAGIAGSFVGFKTRWSILTFILTSCYLFAIPNLFGKINHNHHIVWFAVVLFASPCASYFSADAILKRKKNGAVIRNSRGASIAFLGLWSVIGLIYFFPGFWKLWSCGLDWALTDNFKLQLYSKWFELGDWQPLIRLDRSPLVLQLCGLFTVAFELFFVFLIFHKPFRTVAVICGLLFHLATWLFMDIFFVVLVLSYFSFVNWERWLPVKANHKIDPHVSRVHKWSVGVLLLGVLSFGTLKVHSWPFSVYPTFDEFVPLKRQTLVYEGVTQDGVIVALDKSVLREKYSPERLNRMEWDIIKDWKNKGDVTEQDILPIFFVALKKNQKELRGVRVFLETVSINPDAETPQKRMLILNYSY